MPARAPEMIEEVKALVREVMVAEPVERYIISIIGACTPGGPEAIPEVSQYLRFGPSPRGAQALIMCAKVNALLEGRVTVSYEDIDDAIIPSLRHRLLRNFQAEAENVSAESILEQAVKRLKTPALAMLGLPDEFTPEFHRAARPVADQDAARVRRSGQGKSSVAAARVVAGVQRFSPLFATATTFAISTGAFTGAPTSSTSSCSRKKKICSPISSSTRAPRWDFPSATASSSPRSRPRWQSLTWRWPRAIA